MRLKKLKIKGKLDRKNKEEEMLPLHQKRKEKHQVGFKCLTITKMMKAIASQIQMDNMSKKRRMRTTTNQVQKMSLNQRKRRIQSPSRKRKSKLRRKKRTMKRSKRKKSLGYKLLLNLTSSSPQTTQTPLHFRTKPQRRSLHS